MYIKHLGKKSRVLADVSGVMKFVYPMVEKYIDDSWGNDNWKADEKRWDKIIEKAEKLAQEPQFSGLVFDREKPEEGAVVYALVDDNVSWSGDIDKDYDDVTYNNIRKVIGCLHHDGRNWKVIPFSPIQEKIRMKEWFKVNSVNEKPIDKYEELWYTKDEFGHKKNKGTGIEVTSHQMGEDIRELLKQFADKIVGYAIYCSKSRLPVYLGLLFENKEQEKEFDEIWYDKLELKYNMLFDRLKDGILIFNQGGE